MVAPFVLVLVIIVTLTAVLMMSRYRNHHRAASLLTCTNGIRPRVSSRMNRPVVCPMMGRFVTHTWTGFAASSSDL
ncbi:hypothetical protein ACFFX0_25460 [Citricoccus parietis]|uniref:Secreted protein n=1 Tax=Citricoccus parietis TaxID=592307 RepID=A0ABV5G5Y1_9MICC